MPDVPAHVLVVAFRPFGGRRRNESLAALRGMRLPARAGPRTRTLVLPVSWRRAPARLARALAHPRLGAVVLCGEAGKRPLPTAETWGRNRARRLRDEDGAFPPAARLDARGAVRRRATWAPGDVVAVLARAGVPARVSRDAGGFLCNAVLYAALECPRVRARRLPVTFLHLPVPGAGAGPEVDPALLARALTAVVREAVERLSAPAAVTPRPRRRAPRR